MAEKERLIELYQETIQLKERIKELKTELSQARQVSRGLFGALQKKAKRESITEVKVKKLHPEAILPRYSTIGSAGADVFALEDITLNGQEVSAVRTGIALEIPEGYEVQVRPRSGMALKIYSYDLPNSPGTIDSDYRGELKIIVRNIGGSPLKIEKGQRIAQIILAPIARAEFSEVERLLETDRGAGGFGSTGE